ncbi:unnamed protein product [Rotaria socialis]
MSLLLPKVPWTGAATKCNGVDSSLGCKYVTVILQIKFDQLNDLRKHSYVTLADGTIALLSEVESSVNNRIKLLKKKREKLTTATTISSVLPTTKVSISHCPMRTTAPSDAPIPINSSNSSSINFSVAPTLTDEISTRISETIIEWLKKKQQELNLKNTNFHQGIDFHVELNKRRDGVVFRCKCGIKNSIGQKKGVLVFSNIYRHFKSINCSMMTDKRKNSTESSTDNEENDSHANLLTTNQSFASTPRQSKLKSVISTSSKVNNRNRSASNASKRKRPRLN